MALAALGVKAIQNGFSATHFVADSNVFFLIISARYEKGSTSTGQLLAPRTRPDP